MFALINWVSEEYGITHYKSDCLHLQQKEVISQRQPQKGHQCTYDSTTTGSCYPPFSFHRRRKNIRIREKKSFTRQNSPDSKVSGFKVPTLDSRFKISGDTTKPGSFYFGYVHLCINDKTNSVQNRTISSSVNLVLNSSFLQMLDHHLVFLNSLILNRNAQYSAISPHFFPSSPSETEANRPENV